MHFPRTVVLVALVATGCGPPSAAPTGSAASSVTAAGTATVPAAAGERAPASTPGALADPAPTLTQLCTPGYTSTVRPPAAYTTELKRRQIADLGYTDRALSSYEEDHLVPLELGGAPRDPKNLWPEPIDSARVKDREEDALHIGVCTHRMSLADAQRKILADWGPAG